MSPHLHVLSQLAANTHLYQLASAAADHLRPVLAANVPNPTPVSPGLGNAVTTLISWVKWLALAACGVSAVVAGAMIATGSATSRSELAERGKTALLWSVVGAVVVGVGIPLVNQAFRLG